MRTSSTTAASSFETSSSSSRKEDLVKTTIQKMMHAHEATTPNVTPEALYKASYRLQVRLCVMETFGFGGSCDTNAIGTHPIFFSLQKKLDEVQACLTDVVEEEDKATELETTDMALEQAAAAYIDLLDLVREADETTAVQYKKVREASATRILELRQELDHHRRQVCAI